jgi:hypothetical protein
MRKRRDKERSRRCTDITRNKDKGKRFSYKSRREYSKNRKDRDKSKRDMMRRKGRDSMLLLSSRGIMRKELDMNRNKNSCAYKNNKDRKLSITDIDKKKNKDKPSLRKDIGKNLKSEKGRHRLLLSKKKKMVMILSANKWRPLRLATDPAKLTKRTKKNQKKRRRTAKRTESD